VKPRASSRLPNTGRSARRKPTTPLPTPSSQLPSVKAAQAKLTEAKLNLAYTRVIAPISGLSTRAQQSEGSLANANTTLLTTVSQVDPIWVLFNVSDNEQLRLDKAMAEGRLTLPRNNAFEVSVKLSDGSTFPRSGRINFADTRVNPQTGTYEMRAEITNSDLALKPGQFVRVALKAHSAGCTGGAAGGSTRRTAG
jgi:membrane fusion protein (multidrug efflux system)